MRLLLAILLAAVAQTPLAAFTEEQIVLEVQRGGGARERIEIPVDSVDGVSVVSNGPIRVKQDQRGVLATVSHVVKNASLRVVKEIAGGILLLSHIQNGWAFLQIDSQPSAFRSGVELSVTVPRAVPKLRVQSSHGGVNVVGFTGDVEAEAVGGHIHLDRIGGGAAARTGGGEISIGEVGAKLSAYSGGGSITARRVEGAAFLETEGGNIQVGRVDGAIQASTGGGNVEIGRAGGTVTASSGQGIIRVDRAAGQVVAQTREGSIKVSESKGVRAFSGNGVIYVTASKGPLNASAKTGDIVARISSNARVAHSELYTGAGDITVYLSGKVAVTVEAVSAAPDGGKIISEFREIPVHPWSGSGDRRTHASGILNGGGPVLRITAASGKIYIRRNSD